MSSNEVYSPLISVESAWLGRKFTNGSCNRGWQGKKTILDSRGFDPRARQRTVRTAVDRLQGIRDINSSYAILYKLLYKALTLQKDAKHSVVQGLVEKIRRSSKAEKFCCCSLGIRSHDTSRL